MTVCVLERDVCKELTHPESLTAPETTESMRINILVEHREEVGVGRAGREVVYVKHRVRPRCSAVETGLQRLAHVGYLTFSQSSLAQ